MQYQAAALSALVAIAAGATLNADNTNFEQVISDAASGDSVMLAAGTYAVTTPIVIDKTLEIVGEGADFVVGSAADAVFAFGNMEGYASTLDRLTVTTATGSGCALGEPYALQANFSIEILEAYVRNNNVNLRTDVGVWHNERKLNDFYFEDCHYSVDHPEKMSGGIYKLMGNCRSELDFSVAFNKLGGAAPTGCGTTIKDYGRFTSYEAQIEGQWEEYVEKISDEENLRIPVLREGNAVTNILVQIDTVANVAATINSKWNNTLGCDPTSTPDCPANCYPGSNAAACQPTGCEPTTTEHCPEECHMYSTDPACYPDGCDPATDPLCPETCHLYSNDPACYPGGCDPATNVACPSNCTIGSTEPECNTGGCNPDVDEHCPVTCRPGSIDPTCQSNGCTIETNIYCPPQCHIYSTEPECYNPGGCDPDVIADCPDTCLEGSTLPECNPGGCDPNDPVQYYGCPAECNMYSTAPECNPYEGPITGSITTKAIHAATGNPLAGVEAQIIDEEGNVVDTQLTNELGVATFQLVEEGPYTVKILTEVTDPVYGTVQLVGDPDPDNIIDAETTVTVTRGQTSNAGVFPYDNEGTITGRLTAGDFNTPLIGEPVQLKNGAGVVVGSTVTDGEGRYAFVKLSTSPQDYQVIAPDVSLFDDILEDEPFEVSDGALDGLYFVPISPTATSVANVDFHYVAPPVPVDPTSNITGKLYTTTTGAPIGGVTVELTDPITDEVIATTTTGPDGTYIFTDVVPGTSYIIDTPSENPNDPTSILTKDYHDPTKSGTETPLFVTPGTEIKNVNFGYTPPATIAGNVRNTRDEMISGVDVVMVNSAGETVGNTVTDIDGNYKFEDIFNIDIYTITMTKPAEYLLHADEFDAENGELNGQSPVDFQGSSISDVNFVLTQQNSLTGTVTMVDGTPIEGVPVTLIPQNGEIIRVTVTGPNGEYTFDDVLLGEHHVDVPTNLSGGKNLAEDPDGTVDGHTVVVVDVPNTATVVPPYKYDTTPVVHLGSVTGSTRIANTLNPIADVTVELQDATGFVVASQQTDENGTFLFTDLPAATYTVVAPVNVTSVIGDVYMTEEPDHVDPIDGIVGSVTVNSNPVSLPPYLYTLAVIPTGCNPEVDPDCPATCNPYSTAPACNPPGCTPGVDANCPATCTEGSADPDCNPGCDTANDPNCPAQCSPYSTSALCNPPGCDPALNANCPVTCIVGSTDPACNPGGCDPATNPDCPEGCHPYSIAPDCNIGGCDPALDADCPTECTLYSTDPACSQSGCDPEVDAGCPPQCNVYSILPECSVQPPVFDIEAAINLVDVGFFDGWNHSKIRLETHLPSPFTIRDSLVGVVGMRDGSFEAEVGSISQYVFEPACNQIADGDECIQNVEFDIVACDLTGEYSLEGLIVTCQAEDASGAAQSCPAMTDSQIYQPNVIFFIDTNNFCEVEEFELDALFDLQIEVYATETYQTPETIFDLGTMSYWQITVDTSASGVSLYNAEVTYVERTTDGDCSAFDDYMGDIAGNAEFSQTYETNAQTISMPFQVTSQMACATSDRTGNAITMNFTVLVDYDDGSGARRRRSADGLMTRDAGEVAVDKEAGVRYTAEDLAQAAAVGAGAAAGATAANQEEESNMMMIGGAIAAILLLCCCCCCCVAAGVVMMRRRKKASQLNDSLVSQQSAMGFTDGTSTMSFNGQPNYPRGQSKI